MNTTSTLVEHFFRREYGRLVALLTRRFGGRNLDLVEDVVQSALSRALLTWPRSGSPSDPSAWLYRTAKNLAIDAIRRDQVLAKIQLDAAFERDASAADGTAAMGFDDEVGDEPLRLLFLCCHPAIPAESRVALALKTVGGFGTREIASGLLTSEANAEKRIVRAKDKLRELDLELADLHPDDVRTRLETVLATIYLIFNEGFATSQGPLAIRRDLCDEAIRLARMTASHSLCRTPAAFALLALFLMHAARFDSRIDEEGYIVLLADQDRSRWNWNQIREAMEWMAESARGDALSRYHIEAAIAWEHCRATDLQSTDWDLVTRNYELLCRHYPTPMAQLNLALSRSYTESVAAGVRELLAISENDRRRLRPWWDCAMAQLSQRSQDQARALSHWRDALALAHSEVQRQFIQQQIDRIQGATHTDGRPETGPAGVNG